MTQQAWMPEERRRPAVLAGGSQFVQDQVARACAAAGVTPVFVAEPAEALALDPVVLLIAPGRQSGRIAGSREVVVVGAVEEESQVWATAAELPSSRVVLLPQGADWLVEHLGRRLNPAGTGTVLGVLGAAGGIGVSTFAAWCARSAAQRLGPTLLVDGQPFGGGLELSLGLEDRPGVRWHDLADLRGTLSPEQLAVALPMAGSVAVLSHAVRPDLGGVAPEDGTAAAGVVLEAARGAFATSILDLGCGGAAVRELVSACDRIVLLVPARPRGITAARRLLQVWSAVPVTVVLRGPVLDGMDGWTAADLLGRPAPLACLPFVRGAALAEADGRVLEDTLPRSARRIVAAVLDGVGGTTP